jgi:hypothetical protein
MYRTYLLSPVIIDKEFRYSPDAHASPALVVQLETRDAGMSLDD